MNKWRTRWGAIVDDFVPLAREIPSEDGSWLAVRIRAMMRHFPMESIVELLNEEAQSKEESLLEGVYRAMRKAREDSASAFCMFCGHKYPNHATSPVCIILKVWNAVQQERGE